MRTIRIGSREIGRECPPFVVAEIGINHEGSREKAFQLADAAIDAGADCVKFQCHITEAEMIPTDMRPGRISDERLWDIIKRCELDSQTERDLKRHVEARGAIYLCTPFSREAADRLQAMEVPAFKIGSGECNNLPLLEHIARWRKPVILSTGMNDLESVRASAAVFERHDCPFMLTHCTSMYPTPYDKVRLAAIPELQRAFDVPIGLSDHSVGIYTCLGAVALGACLLEKHFTVSRAWPGPDMPVSIEPQELAELVRGARAVFAARGGAKTVLQEERAVIDFAYASVVSVAPIRKGETFSLDNVWVKRPGTGPIHARELSRLLGRVAAADIPVDVQVGPIDIVEWA